MERMIGRPLLRSEHVHHKNHNTFDNKEENLELLTHGQHSSLHGKTRIRFLKAYWKKNRKK